jgi:hypothetical protein
MSIHFFLRHLVDTENDSAESENSNWAYRLLEIVLTGAFIQIICATGKKEARQIALPGLRHRTAGALLTRS